MEKQEKETRSIKGKKGRAKGKVFELKVRKDLEAKGWIIVKWSNQVDFEKNALVPAKSKFNPFLKRVMNEGSGIPDFLAYQQHKNFYEIIGVESKYSKYLDAEEKKKLKWLLDHKIFNRIIIGYKTGRGEIKYVNFKNKKK